MNKPRYSLTDMVLFTLVISIFVGIMLNEYQTLKSQIGNCTTLLLPR